MQRYDVCMPIEISSWKEYENRIQAATSTEALDALEQELFGRKSGALTLALKKLSGASPEVLREKGRALNEAKKSLTQALTDRRMELSQSATSTLSQTDPIDI